MPDLKNSAAKYVPDSRDLSVLTDAVQECRGCDLYRNATQAVFGMRDAGPGDVAGVELMMVGEQPGDQEDKQGRPFVGPAGKLLDECLEEAGIDRSQVYVTNAVKHFKWEPRGKIRLHKKPGVREIRACNPWLQAEIQAVEPRLIVCLGSSAAQALLGAQFRVTQSRGVLQHAAGLPPLLATIHPSAILRARTHEDRERERRAFIEDLRQAESILRRVR
ncbi:UdgX family uracil-DNA binding protein [Occallatibacter riparius]|uniref:Type-4 uracil-DNA glycosylase n=1 Tax=Occallatibacter riparius TaxID=1002689 RepID=A0A9J7BNK8_9BACT|nr:UdgX family uracil-DNA binding protein [Occallatibacter riparius]UWZ84207.1 UdgX family uracil-DNA binding protein [Occallatibacter riparius]